VRKASRWRATFLAIASLVVVLLSLGGWRLLRQERSLERQRTTERLENAASLVVRESERALSRAPNEARLDLVWDVKGLRRVAGAPLLWSPAPELRSEAPAGGFAAGETLEHGVSSPEQAIHEYAKLLNRPEAAMRAGALVRIARCQRKLGRTREALGSYEQLAALGATPVAGAPAELVALHERVALFRALGQTDAAAREEHRLRTALEQGHYSLDRTTFAFYEQSVKVSREARAWAEAVELLGKRASDFARGAEILSAGGRRFAAEWSREGSRGTGRLVEMTALEQKLAEAIQLPGIEWRLVDAQAEKRAVGLLKRAGEVGLPWGVLVSLPEGRSGTSPSFLTAGLVLSGLLVLVTLYLAFRAVERELHVAHMQSEFVSAVSHEFRTPITALTHLTEILENGGAPEERKPAYYAALRRETRRLHEMVETLLDFGRMESGRYKYRPERLDLVEFVRGLVEEFREQPSAARHEVVFEADREQHAISADPETLRRAVWNLLDNAAKYSPPGKRVVTQVHSAGECAGVSVQDEGPGIPSDEQATIFQKFVRGRGARESGVKGTGIGLAMVDAITRAHGGRVEFSSRPGEGSRFTILLPEEVKQ
jgi:signal transduction histidine kinase